MRLLNLIGFIGIDRDCLIYLSTTMFQNEGWSITYNTPHELALQMYFYGGYNFDYPELGREWLCPPWLWNMFQVRENELFQKEPTRIRKVSKNALHIPTAPLTVITIW